jgi:hypothetical protein
MGQVAAYRNTQTNQAFRRSDLRCFDNVEVALRQLFSGSWHVRPEVARSARRVAASLMDVDIIDLLTKRSGERVVSREQIENDRSFVLA